MRKVFSLLALLLAISTSAVAEQLSPEAALARLNAGKMKVAGVSKERLRLVHTAEQQDVRLFYIFQNADDGRSLILGADDLLWSCNAQRSAISKYTLCRRFEPNCAF